MGTRDPMMLTRFRALAPLNSRQLSCTPTATVLGAVSADGVGRVTIVNPAKRNAMTLRMYQQGPAAVLSATPSGTRVTVLTGAGDEAFGAGSDISESPQVRTGATAAAAYSAVEDEASAALLEIEHPVLACIHGPCY